jgi:hypothetical protein
VKVDEPEVSTETIAEVVTAEDDAPPATPPTPKIVVEPIVVVKVEEPEVSTETTAEVVMAEEDAPLDPPAPAYCPMSANIQILFSLISYSSGGSRSDGTRRNSAQGGSSGRGHVGTWKS